MNKKIQKIVNRLEEEAEGGNYHSMIQMYERMAHICIKYAGEEIALKIMQQIKCEGGFIP